MAVTPTRPVPASAHAGDAAQATTAYATCPLCEATCGLELRVGADGRIQKVRGDSADVFSHGFICPKGASIQALEEDPDRLRAPLVRRDGELVPATWEEAFAEIESRLPPLIERHGPDSVAVYLGNPVVHNLSLVLYARVLLKALRSRNLYSASTVDQMPKQVSAGLMFGTMLSVPIPDVDRTDYLLILGANPLASNGSLMTAPDMRGRLRRIRARGGRVVVIDPRFSRTATEADEHHFIRPGTDALLLAALVNTLFAEDLTAPGRLAEHTNGIEDVRGLTAEFTPERAAPACGIPAENIRRLARELAAAPRAAVYGRIGTCTQEFGTLASWLVDVLNVLTGNLDREGGAMFPRAAAGQANTQGSPAKGRGVRFGRWCSRVRGLPEVYGELPVACLAEEIDTPGEGQVRGLITIAGNPGLSTPNSGRLARALGSLEFMVSLDVYVNETTRHADVILPGPTPLRHAHYDLAFYQLAIRNVANFTPAVLEREPGVPEEWETLLRLTGIITGQGPSADLEALDRFVALAMVQRECADASGPLAGRDPEELMVALDGRRGPERLLDLMLRSGPYGDGFGTRDGLTLSALEESPHGVDLGPLTERIPEVLRTPSGRIELAPEPIAADIPRLRSALDRSAADQPVLIGRRQLRSNNSWMHNLEPLVRGKESCTVHVHPDDARRWDLVDGERARVSSRVGTIEVQVEVTEEIMPGVVSIPHGWGHDLNGVRMSVASRHAGANSNALADEALIDPLSGNAVLNGIPVNLVPA
ncbi:MAG TPA: molybdopterin-dependent oxidoreductase [Solirubrobacteraceae bacterium]|nr:molybdopterin-dependent oxidoreductase [Solirubrobacteraceae bacterium]